MSGRRWLVLTVRVPSEELRDELTEGLVALGGSAVEEEADLLVTYLPEPPDPDAFLGTASDRLASIAGGTPEILWSWRDDEDWSATWKEGLAPRTVGARITVTQPWNPVDEEGDGIVIVIDPATAFGTGEHASTRGALRLLEQSIEGGEHVLDVGAGSAILSIAAVRLGAARVLAAESDAGSMDTAAENVERSGVAGIELVHALVDDEFLARVAADRPLDVIVANVLSGVLIPLLPAFSAALASGGRVILGGILDSESAEVVEAARRTGLRPDAVDREGEWWTGRFTREA